MFISKQELYLRYTEKILDVKQYYIWESTNLIYYCIYKL
jgi:hypothetical protein